MWRSVMPVVVLVPGMACHLLYGYGAGPDARPGDRPLAGDARPLDRGSEPAGLEPPPFRPDQPWPDLALAREAGAKDLAREAKVPGVALDSQDHSGPPQLTSSLVWPHSVGNDVNRWLLVVVATVGVGGGKVTGVSWAGNPLTPSCSSSGGPPKVEFWHLPKPTPGSGSVIVTLASPAFVVAGSSSWTQVWNIACPPSASPSTQTSITYGITSAPGNVILDGVAVQSAGQPAPGQDKLWSESKSGGAAGSSFRKATSTATWMTWAWGNPAAMAYAAVRLTSQ